ncbi:DUF4253 domain-containing protein [Streptomyces sp. NPDC056347]|uniref:DUF4253 domain-containing protein n=1 Tax=Streptomyces sp. NPDC056347 TaxID=3345790 RepID=UPI0035DC7C4E
MAAGPTTAGEALRVAAEHFAFCPDDVRQSRRPQPPAACAERILGAGRWDFWWN